MKKRFITALLVIACVFALVGCGASNTSSEPEQLELTEEQQKQWYNSASQFVLTMNEALQTGQAEARRDDPVYGPAFNGWENALKDIGEVQNIVGKSCYFTRKDGTVTVTVKGSRHDADVVFTMEGTDQGYELKGIATNVEYSMEEKIQQAALNTLLGMGKTFVILILLAFVIASFGLIMNGAARKAQKSKAKSAPVPAAEEPSYEATDKEIAAESADDEELIAVISAAVAAADNDELIAVISAAVAAYEEEAGSAAKPGVNGFVARTIRKSRRK